MNNMVLCVFEPTDIPWGGIGCLVGTVGFCRAHRLHMQAVCNEFLKYGGEKVFVVVL